jgi:hypothetical protein
MSDRCPVNHGPCVDCDRTPDGCVQVWGTAAEHAEALAINATYCLACGRPHRPGECGRRPTVQRPGRHRACTGGNSGTWGSTDDRDPWPCGRADCTACAPDLTGHVRFRGLGPYRIVRYALDSLPPGYSSPYQLKGKPVGISANWWLVTAVTWDGYHFVLTVRRTDEL